MFKKINSKKISDEIVEQFRDLLGKRSLKPGDELPPERELSEILGVSRSPLREALSTLQAMGLVEIKPRSKIIVKSAAVKFVEDPLSFLIAENIERIFELLEIRRQMESWAAYKATEKATKEEIEVLREIVQRDQENFNRGIDDPKTDADFHVAISTAAHNTLFSHLTASCHHLLWSSQKVAREKIFRKEENRLLICQQHLRIFEAIVDGDKTTASREARKHINFVEEELRKTLKEESRLRPDH